MPQIVYILLGLFIVVTGYFSPVSTLADSLFNISAITLSLLYALFGFLILQGQSFKSKNFEIISLCKAFSMAIAGWGISITYLGIIFKINFFPYSMLLLKIGLILLIFGVLHLFFVFRANKKLKIFFKYTLPHGLIAFIAGMWFYFVSPHQIISFYIKNPKQRQILIQLYDRWQNKKSSITKDDFFLTYYIYLSKQREQSKKQSPVK